VKTTQNTLAALNSLLSFLQKLMILKKHKKISAEADFRPFSSSRIVFLKKI